MIQGVKMSGLLHGVVGYQIRFSKSAIDSITTALNF